MSSNTCGKACLITCLSCLGLMVLLAVIAFIGTCAGCAVFSGLFGGLWRSIGGTMKINNHFKQLEEQGWEVDWSQSGQSRGYGAEVEAGQPMIWRARENPDDEWIVYVWELRPEDPEALEKLGEEGEFDLSALGGWNLVPRTEAALEVHEELELPLPDDFELEPWGEDGHGKDDGDEDRDRARDRRDRDTDEEEGKEEEDGGRRRTKEMKLAA